MLESTTTTCFQTVLGESFQEEFKFVSVMSSMDFSGMVLKFCNVWVKKCCSFLNRKQ